MYPTLSRQRFADYLGTEFTIMLEGGQRVSLTLVEVNPLGKRETGQLTIESYSLLFEGPTAPMLPRSSFQFVHPYLGELVIFIIPLGPRSGIMRYEAVFD